MGKKSTNYPAYFNKKSLYPKIKTADKLLFRISRKSSFYFAYKQERGNKPALFFIISLLSIFKESVVKNGV